MRRFNPAIRAVLIDVQGLLSESIRHSDPSGGPTRRLCYSRSELIAAFMTQARDGRLNLTRPWRMSAASRGGYAGPLGWIAPRFRIIDVWNAAGKAVFAGRLAVGM